MKDHFQEVKEFADRQEVQRLVERRKRGRHGWVYVIQLDNDDRFVKIGITHNVHPKPRLTAIYTGLPYGFEILGLLKTRIPRKIELEIHQKFISKKVKGEWFNLDQEDID